MGQDKAATVPGASAPATVAGAVGSGRAAGAGSAGAARGSALFLSRAAVGVIVPAGCIILYELAARMGLVEARLLPAPSAVLAVLWELAASGELLAHTLATLWRVYVGFLIGAAAGTVLGAATGASPMLHRLFDPTLQALRAIPSLAWVPLFILWLGIFEPSKIALIALGVFFPVYLGVNGAIHSVDRKLVEVGRAFRLSRPALAWRILFPAVLPEWVISLRSGLGLGFMFVVAAEIMGASEGLGYLLVDGQQLGKPAQILAAIFAFAVIGKASDALLAAIAAPFLRWQDKH